MITKDQVISLQIAGPLDAHIMGNQFQMICL